MDWHRRRRVTTSLFICGIALLVGLAAASVGFGWRTLALNNRLAELREANEHVHAILLALVDTETGVRGFAITGNPDYLAPYYSGSERTSKLMARAAETPLLSEIKSPRGGSLRDLVAAHQDAMASLVDAVRRTGLEAAHDVLNEGTGKRIMDEIRETIGAAEEKLHGETERLAAGVETTARGLSMLLIGCIALAIALSAAQFRLFRQEITQRGAVEADLQQRHREIALISQLADSLYASNSRDESYGVIEAFARDILAGTSGCLYVYNNSRDQLTGAARWGDVSVQNDTAGYFGPDDCWALRRGKGHIGTTAGGQVQCQHVAAEPPRSYMCLPISARGQTSGLLYLQSPDVDAERALGRVMGPARNFADQLSLALVNIELRERLQNLAIRDPLTDLYNRRFLDDTLGRELLLAQRRNWKLSVLMLDIDHFKRVNDSFGHAAGDEILKQVAHYVIGALRRSDIVCRYGGEEILAVLPDCGVEEATRKAEAIRHGVKSLLLRAGGIELPPITVSIGIACFPDTTSDKAELLSCADQALYQAKRLGRDRVVMAEPVSTLAVEGAMSEQQAKAATRAQDV